MDSEGATMGGTFRIGERRIALKGDSALPVVGWDAMLASDRPAMAEAAPYEDVPGQFPNWAAHVAHIPGGLVVGDPFTIYGADGSPLEESFTLHVSPFEVWHERVTSKNYGREIESMSGWYLALANWSHFVYFHWFAQCLASLELVHGRANLPPFRLVVPRLAFWQRQSLHDLGFQDDRLLELSPGRVVRFEHLLYPSDLQNQPAVISARLVSVCRRLRETVETKISYTLPKIYLSRLDADSRHMEDEGHLIDILRARGYRVLTTSMMDFHHEVMAFADARIIVAAVGSGMTNIAFARPNAGVVELNSLGKDYHLFKWLAQRCQLEVESVVLDRPQTSKDVVSSWRLGEDLGRVIDAIDSMERRLGL